MRELVLNEWPNDDRSFPDLRIHVTPNVPFDFIAKCVFDHLTNPFHELSTYSSNTIRTINRSWITSLALSFITLCPSYHFSWDLRRDLASSYLRSIEIGANVKMKYVVVVVRWYTGSYEVWVDRWVVWSYEVWVDRWLIWHFFFNLLIACGSRALIGVWCL